MSEKDNASKNKYMPAIIALICLIFLGIWQKEQVMDLISDSFLLNLDNSEQEEINLQTITDSKAYFATETVPIREKTEIKVTYIDPEEPTHLTLNLQMDKEGTGRNFIIKDPLLDNLTWAYTENSEYSLFQKNIKYNNMDDFLAAKEYKVLVDEEVQKEFPQFANSPIFSDVENIENYDFILTNYHQSYSEGEYKVWQIITNTNDVFLENNKIFWQLIMPKVNEDNPIKLKIDINYAQPAQAAAQ